MKGQIKDKLLKLYDKVPNHNTILNGIENGENNFIDALSGIYNNQHFNTDNSQVHSKGDVENQAFLLCVGLESQKDMARVSFLTYGAHWIDDFFDRPDFDPTPEIMSEYRHDIRELLDVMGSPGKFGHLTAKTAHNPEAVYKAIHRIAYGGLIQLAESEEKQDQYLKEYKQLALEGIAEEVKAEVSEIRDIAYWTTTKTVMEMFQSPEKGYDSTLAELWSIAYAPALYLHDGYKEKENNELNLFSKEDLTVDEMQKMIHIAIKHLPNYESCDLKQHRLQSMQVFDTFKPVMPVDVYFTYQGLNDVLKKEVAK